MKTIEMIKALVSNKIDEDMLQYNEVWVNGFDLTDEESNRFLEWLTAKVSHVRESYDSDLWVTNDDIKIIVDWYGEDI